MKRTFFYPLKLVGRRSLFVFVVLSILLSAAHAQDWETVIHLSDDQSWGARPNIVVDSTLNIHLFETRTIIINQAVTTSLYYQRFDNWGRPISEVVELVPGVDMNDDDNQPGVLIDRQQNIHVFWVRYDYPPPIQILHYYTKLNRQGEFLVEPFVVPRLDHGAAFSRVNMVQAPNGDIWVAGWDKIAAFSEEGEVLVPLQNVGGDSLDIIDGYVATTSDNQVWVAVRDGSNSGGEIKALRIDPGHHESYMLWPSPFPLAQIGLGGFFIDPEGGFHLNLWADHIGRFYLHDARDGSPVDTHMISPGSAASGGSFFVCKDDTLILLHQFPDLVENIRIDRFLFNGERASDPEFHPRAGNFSMSSGMNAFVTQDDGYWVAGGDIDWDTHTSYLSMLHIPGPNEPPSQSIDPYASITQNIELIRAYPNPFNSSVSIPFELSKPELVDIRIYNILGQEVYNFGRRLMLPGRQELVWEGVTNAGAPLASGIYVVHARTADQLATTKIELLR